MNRSLPFRRLIPAITLFFATAGLFAQSYDAALGLRLGTDWGATAQVRLPVIHKNFVVEGILQSSLSTDEGTFTLLGKQHQNILTRRLNIFYGAGLHTGWNNEIEQESGSTRGTPFGITGVIGAEATFGRLNLSYDVKPVLNVTGGSRVFIPQTGVSVRYVIAKRHDIWDKQKEREVRKRRKGRQRDKRREERARERDTAGKRWYEIWKRG